MLTSLKCSGLYLEVNSIDCGFDFGSLARGVRLVGCLLLYSHGISPSILSCYFHANSGNKEKLKNKKKPKSIFLDYGYIY